MQSREDVGGTYAEGSRHWADLCIFHASWHRTQYSGRLVGQGPTATLRIQSSKWARTRSKWRSCEASSKKLDKWAPAKFFCIHAASVTHTHTHTHSINRHYWCILVFSQLYLAQSCKKTVRYLTLSRTTNQFHIFNFFFTVCFIWKVLSFLIVS